jgi:hypothetical protein
MKTSITSWALVLICASTLASWGAPAPKEKQAGIGASFRGPIGLQLYSLRDDFAKDVPGTLAKVRDYGIKYVELAGTYKPVALQGDAGRAWPGAHCRSFQLRAVSRQNG